MLCWGSDNFGEDGGLPGCDYKRPRPERKEEECQDWPKKNCMTMREWKRERETQRRRRRWWWWTERKENVNKSRQRWWMGGGGRERVRDSARAIYIYTYIHIYIYIYRHCTFKTWSKNNCLGGQNLVQVLFSPPFCLFKDLLLSAGRMRFFKTRKEDKHYHFLSQNLVQLCCETCLDQILTQPWTNIWLNLFNIISHFPFSQSAETTMLIAFSATMSIFKPTPKN